MEKKRKWYISWKGDDGSWKHAQYLLKQYNGDGNWVLHWGDATYTFSKNGEYEQRWDCDSADGKIHMKCFTVEWGINQLRILGLLKKLPK